MSDLETLMFAVSSTVQENMQHLYSTPYNYEVNDAYYGSFSSETQIVPHLNLMLYHVAAKVDITWHVADTMRILANKAEAVRLTQMDVCNLFNDSSYCFKPMENSSGATPLAPAAGKGDTLNIVSPTDEGLWWEGRSYFYTIPYTITGEPNYFPLQLLMRTNDSEGSGYQLTLKQPIDTTGTFVPWIRGNIRLTQALSNTTDTKIGSN